MILHHFTSTTHLPKIVRSGELRLTDNMLDPSRRGLGPPVLWMLTESTLGGHTHGVKFEHWPVDKSEIRFTLDVPDHWVRAWLPWAKAQHINHRWLEQTVKIAGGYSAAEQWRVAFRPIKRDRWVEVRNMHTQEVLDV